VPRLGSTGAVRCRTIRNALASENGLDTAERIASDGDPVWKDEWLLFDPSVCGELIIEVIACEQAYRRRHLRSQSAGLTGAIDLIQNVGTRRRAQAVTAPKRAEESPTVSYESVRARRRRTIGAS
jgi:hypothetical protein